MHHRSKIALAATLALGSLPATGATGMKYLGRISQVALQRVLAALDRERCARLMEESPRIASNLMTSIASTGRKVGRMAGCCATGRWTAGATPARPTRRPAIA